LAIANSFRVDSRKCLIGKDFGALAMANTAGFTS